MHMQRDEVVMGPSADAPPTPADRMIGGVDVRDIGACAGLLLRRAARLSTQLFDAHLQPAGLTVGQFGVMARLFAGTLSGPPMTMKDLSSAIGMDPTTLNRTLKPLEAQGFVLIEPDARDRRARIVRLTPTGHARLAEAAPLWRAADEALRRTIGAETTVALSGLLGIASEKLKTVS
jgi:DNA-binding MarR family transcriptional regulator